jgi:hypothetical protein
MIKNIAFRQFDGVARFLRTNEQIARLRDNNQIVESIRRMDATGEAIRRICFTPIVNVRWLKI